MATKMVVDTNKTNFFGRDNSTEITKEYRIYLTLSYVKIINLLS